MSPNGLALMALSGALAAFGLASNSLHIVIGAIWSPPVSSRWYAWRYGRTDLAKGYGLLVLGAFTAKLWMWVVGTPSPGEKPSYGVAQLIPYWTTVTSSSVLITIAAKSVLTAAVMVALGLVPSAAMVGLGAAFDQFSLAGQGFGRWGLEALLVVGIPALVMLLKRRTTQRRTASA